MTTITKTKPESEWTSWGDYVADLPQTAFAEFDRLAARHRHLTHPKHLSQRAYEAFCGIETDDQQEWDR